MYFYSDPDTKRFLSGPVNLTLIPDGKTREDDSLDVGVMKLSPEGGAMPPYPAINCVPLPPHAAACPGTST